MDVEEFGSLVGRLDYPMLAVTASDGDETAACLVGFATQSSIHPPRFLVCLSKKNHTFGVALRSEMLAVHVLAEDDADLAELLGHETGDEVDKLSRCKWSAGPAGVPVLDAGMGWLAGRILNRFEVGDHMAFLLEPVQVERRHDGPPLRFQQVKDIEPGHGA